MLSLKYNQVYDISLDCSCQQTPNPVRFCVKVSSQFHDFVLESWKVWCKKFTYGIFLFKVSSGNTRIMCKICSKLTIKTPQRHHWHHPSVYVVNFEQVLHTAGFFTLLILSCWLCFWLRFSDWNWVLHWILSWKLSMKKTSGVKKVDNCSASSLKVLVECWC